MVGFPVLSKHSIDLQWSTSDFSDDTATTFKLVFGLDLMSHLKDMRK